MGGIKYPSIIHFIKNFPSISREFTSVKLRKEGGRERKKKLMSSFIAKEERRRKE